MIVGRRSVDSGWRGLVMAAAAMVAIAAGTVPHAAAEQPPAIEAAMRAEAEATVKAFNAADAAALANAFLE